LIVQLKRLIAQLKPEKTDGSLDREVNGVAYDSRRVTPGMVFVAVPGQTVDGHDFIGNAIDRGAAAIVSERPVYGGRRVTQIRVADARIALARIAAAFYEYPSTTLKVIGVTGANGKTTVAFLLKQILDGAGIKTGLIGTIRYEIGERIIPAQRTTPEAIEIEEMMAQMVRAGCAACVLEVSSHALEQKRVKEIAFDVGVFTNLTQDHLDYHGDMESYYAAKKRLFDSWGGEGKGGTAVINVDDSFGRRLSDEIRVATLFTYGVSRAADLKASRIKLGRKSTRMVIDHGENQWNCRLPLIGRHNVYNALAAAASALALGVDWSVILSALAQAKPVPGRLERIACGQPFSVFVDYAHTDDALHNVLSTLREITPGRLLLVFGCGGNRDPGKRPRMGAVAARLADQTVITSDNPRKEPPEEIAGQIEAGYRSERTDGVTFEPDRRRALDLMIRAAQPEDTVLIAGKGHETYQETGGTIIPFDDRVYARQSLEALGYQSRR
jgi:UDP-N-acetylmuramoyl-L-alanyl-D-glutamate--2,6-diaminopimelate ligase